MTSNYSPTGKREDFFWAIATAAATTLVVKLAEWAVEEARKFATRREQREDNGDGNNNE